MNQDEHTETDPEATAATGEGRSPRAYPPGRFGSDFADDIPPASAAGAEDLSGAAPAGVVGGEPKVEGPSDLPQVRGYQITGTLGQGGMGTVWRAAQLGTRRQVALKLMGAGLFASPSARRRFEREVELAARLEHPHVARVYESGVYQGVYFYTMELVEGVPLDEYVKARELGTAAVLDLVRRVCLGVQHAHQQGVIHCDLKPSNVLVTPAGEPKVLDFGLAKAARAGQGEERLAVSRAGERTGTLPYMSPEQAAGEPVDTRTDVYSLGVILYRLLTGKSPHDLSGSDQEVMRRISDSDVIRPRRADPGLDRELEALLLKALAREPDRRYASAGAMAEDIGNYLSGDPLIARAPTIGYFLGKRISKYRVPVAAAAAALAVLVGTVAYLRIQGDARQRKFIKDLKAEQALTEQKQREAEQHAREAELNLADAQVREGDVLGLAGRWDEAKGRYEEADRAYRHLSVSPVAAELALWNAYRNSPPELAVFRPDRPPTPPFRPPSGTACELISYWASPEDVAPVAGAGAAPAAAPTTRPVPAPTRQSDDELTFFGHRGAARCAAFAPDSRLFATGGDDGTIKLWEAQTGRGIRSLRAHAGGVRAVAFSPDGLSLLSAGADGLVKLWDRSGRGWLLGRHEGGANAVAFSPDGTLAVSGGDDGMLRTWELRRPPAATGPAPEAFGKAGTRVNAVAFLPDGARVLSGDDDAGGPMKLWDLSSRQLLRHFAARFGRDARSVSVGASPDGSLGACRSADGLRVWDLETGEMLADCTDPRVPAGPGADFVGGQTVLSGYTDGMVKLWDYRARRPVATYTGQRAAVTCVCGSADGRLALSGGEDGTLVLYALAPGDEVRALPAGEGDDAPLTAVQLSHDGRLCLSRDARGTWKLWDAETGRQLQARQAVLAAFTDDGSVIWARDVSVGGPAALTSDGHRVWFAGPRGAVHIWDVASDRLERSFEVPPLDAGGGRAGASAGSGALEVTDLALVGDGHQALAAYSDGTLRLWDAAKGGLVRAFSGHIAAALGVAVSRDGRLALSCGADRLLRLWDLQTGESLGVLGRHEGAVEDCALSDDGRLAVSVSTEERAVKFWDVPGRRELRSQDPGEDPAPDRVGGSDAGPSARPPAGPSDESSVPILPARRPGPNRLLSVALSGDGRRAACAGSNRDAILWDLAAARGALSMRSANAAALARLAGGPDDPDALETLGEWYATRGNDSWAAELLEAARRGGAGGPTLRLARCYWRLGDRELARRRFADALQRNEAPAEYLSLCLDALGRGTDAPRPVPLSGTVMAPALTVRPVSGGRPADGGGPVAGAAPTTAPVDPATFDALAAARLAANGTIRKTEAVGGDGGAAFADAPPAGVLLAGLNVVRDERTLDVKSIQPLYLTATGQMSGATFGDESGGARDRLLAAPGYAVGAVEARGEGHHLAGLWLLYMRIRPIAHGPGSGQATSQPSEPAATPVPSLDPQDAYFSPWVGGRWGRPARIGGDGAPVIGVYGRSAADVKSFGLLQLGPPEDTAPYAVYTPPAGRRVDLLPRVDPAADTWGPPGGAWQRGSWHRTGDEVSNTYDAFVFLELPYRPPREYDYIVEFTRTAGKDALIQMMPKPGTDGPGAGWFDWRLGSEDNTVFGFSYVYGHGVEDNLSTVRRAACLNNGLRHTSVVQVRQGYVAAYLDGRLVRRWYTDFTDLSFVGMSRRDASRLGLRSRESAYVIHRAQVIEVTGAGQSLRDPIPMTRPTTWGAFERLAAAVRDQKTAQTPTVGGTGGGPFHDLPADGAVLTGIVVAAGPYEGGNAIRVIRPIYRTRYGRRLGQIYGDDDGPHDSARALEARDRYAVGAVLARGDRRLRGIRIIFMRLRGDQLDRLDPKDRYESEWIGTAPEPDSPAVLLGGDGNPILGIYGGSGLEVDRLGLLRLDPNAPAPRPTALRGAPARVPGVIRAVDFGEGGEGVAYHDTDDHNTGSAPDYRETGVDIDHCEDVGGGYSVGAILPTEWLAYPVDVAADGAYDLSLRLASPSGGGKLHLEVDGRDATGPIVVPKTNGWQAWRTVRGPGVRLNRGRHVLRVVFDAADGYGYTGEYVCDLNWIEFQRAGGTEPPRPEEVKPAAPPSVPVTLLAADFDAGEELVAFSRYSSDRLPSSRLLSVRREGHPYRGDRAGARRSQSRDGWPVLAAIKPDEWFVYTVEIPKAGVYDLDATVAADGEGGTFHVEVDRIDRTGPIRVPDTRGWDLWKVLPPRPIKLEAGRHQLRVWFDTPGTGGECAKEGLVCDLESLAVYPHGTSRPPVPAPAYESAPATRPAATPATEPVTRPATPPMRPAATPAPATRPAAGASPATGPGG